MILLTYLLLGAGAGLLAGLFGVGGGVILVPVLILTFVAQGFSPEVLVHLAVGTSLAIIVPTAISSMQAHHRQGGVDWSWFRLLAPGIILGAMVGAWTASLLSGLALQSVIGVFMLLVSLQLVLSLQPPPAERPPSLLLATGIGGVMGWASAIFGIGGGTLVVPFLIWCRSSVRQAVGTAAALGFPIAVAGTLGNVWAGWGHVALPDWSTGFIYWPAVAGIVLTSVPFARLGARLAHWLPERLLKRLFALLLFVLGLRFLLA